MSQTKIVIVGEAWGAEEERLRMPFIGAAGYQLNQLLEEAGINRYECYLTNVFNLRPEKNDIETLCGTKDIGIPNRTSLRAGKYIRREFMPELDRLERELAEYRPNLILALGSTAAWAVLGDSRITKVRGTIATGTHGIKTLATYHPAAILRQWELRHVTVLDLVKAKKQSEFPDIRRPSRTIWIEPSYQDLLLYEKSYLEGASVISVDIETAQDMVTCIGFAPTISSAIVVPFTDFRRPGNRYWKTVEEELLAWRWVKRICESPTPKVLQNCLYDVHFLWRRYGIAVRGIEDDTMLLHHALQPESPKGLDFLGSVYTDEAAWKLMRPRGKTTIKRDE